MPAPPASAAEAGIVAKPIEDIMARRSRAGLRSVGYTLASAQGRGLVSACAFLLTRTEMATGVRDKITLACNECKRRNYMSTKSKRNTPDRLEVRKYCRWCGSHTAHRETR